ncbi:hypothetical protein [Micromonospora echinospora]|uniref:hypothetical protein n=1 Tax=Micromonospora echinospora TaxID=1877 RepID=UPI00366FFB42
MSHPALRAGHGAPARIRTKLAVFGVLTAVAVLDDAPGWTILALAATTVAIPLAALAGEPATPRAAVPPAGEPPVPAVGGAPVRSVGEPPVPPAPGRGVGHTSEQGDRAST